jgi:serine/threonine protein kinase
LADAAEPQASDQCSVISNQSQDRAAPQTTSATLKTDYGALITEYSPRTLRHALKGRGRLPPDECVQIALMLSSALEHLHRHGLVHRDIKPSNIIFVEGTPKLADIGLVADVDEARSYVGTVGFIPPEGPGSPQADVYSLGKVLYEMVTGKDRQEFPALPEEFQSNDSLPLKELNQIILRSCEGDRRLRYLSAQAMHDDLAMVAQGRSAWRVRMFQRRVSWIAKGASGLFVLIAVIAFLSWTGARKAGRASNPEAVRLYELGQWHQQQLTDEDMHRAIEYLNQAIQIDPKFTAPYQALVGIYSWGVRGISEAEKDQRIKQIAAKLLSLDPELPAGHVALSWSKYIEGDWRAAEAAIQRALRLDPNDWQAHSFYCYYLSLLGRVEEARIHGKRAHALVPTSRTTATVAAYPFVAARRYDEAIAQLNEALRLDKHFPLAHMWLAKCFEAQANYPAAINEFETSDLLDGDDPAKVAGKYAALRKALAHDGERGYWQQVLELEQAEAALPQEEKKVTQHDRWALPGIYAQLGDKAKALELLKKDVEENGGNDWLKVEPLYNSLRDDPAFQVLLKKSGLEK